MAFGILLKKKLLGDLLPVPDPLTVDPNAVVDPAQAPANDIAFTPTISQLMTPIRVGKAAPIAEQTVDPAQAVTPTPQSVWDLMPKTGLKTSAAMIQPINTPAPQAWKPSAMGIIDRVLGGMTITEANKAAQADHDAELLKPQMDAMRQAQLAFAKTLDPMQQAAYLLNPSEWSKNVATRYGARTVNGGDSAVFGQPGTAGAATYTAPKLGESGGVLYTQTPTASTTTGSIPQAYKPDWKQVENVDANGVKTTSWVDVNDPRNQTTGAQSAPAAPEPTGGVYDQIGQIATSAGAKPEEVGYLKRLAKIESGGNPSAQNGSSTSLFQFHPDTFASVGGTNINDVGDQTKAAIALQRRDRQTLQSMGVAPTDANAYIMHQQGAGGGKALLTAPPEVGAVAALTPVYGSKDIATQAIAGNIGMPYKTPEQKAAANAKAQQMTVGDFTGMWRQKWGGDASAPASGAPGGRMVAGGVQQPDANEDTPLTQAAVDMGAMRYMQTGVMPSLGMGKAAREDKVKIQNRAAELIDKYNIKPEDWATGVAQFKITQGSLQQISKTRNMVEASEHAVEQNMDLVLSLAPKADPGGIPLLNKYTMWAKDKVGGSPEVKAYDSALHTVADEYAKVLTTTSGSGGTSLSDSARAEAYRRLSSAQTLDQLNASFAVIKREMSNRSSSLQQQEDALVGQLKHGLVTPGQTDPSAPATPAAKPKFTKVIQGASDAQNAWLSSAQISGKAGDMGNPFIPRTAKEFDGIKVGQWYVNPADGQHLQKTH